MSRNKTRGFSLIELMVAQALALILLGAGLGLWLTLQHSVISATNSAEITSHLRDLRNTLSVPGQCTLNLTGVPLAIGNPASSVPKLQWFNRAGTGTSLLQAGQSITGTLDITGIKLIPSAVAGPGLISATLQIDLSNNMAPRTIGLLAQTKNGKVSNCWVRMGADQKAANLACQVANGGAYDSFSLSAGYYKGYYVNGLGTMNPGRWNCGLSGGIYVAGPTPYTSKCTPPLSPPPASDPNACMLTIPRSFADAFPGTTVTLSDGSIQILGRPPFGTTLNPDGTCTCFYGSDIPAAVVAQFKCNEQCLQY